MNSEQADGALSEEVGILRRREIEARILAPLIDALGGDGSR